jgi:tetratricopeptide (TPR) repeat protein
MTQRKSRSGLARWQILFSCLLLILPAGARTAHSSPRPKADDRPTRVEGVVKPLPQDDSLVLSPAKDLALQPEGKRKAEALTQYVEGLNLEEDGESEKALEAFEKVLNVDPGQIELASRVAFLLTRDGDYPTAIDILKDAIKAQPKEAAPYLQLAYIYAKYLKKNDQALKYATRAVELAPQNIEAYQRLCEVELAAGNRQKAMETLDRAANVDSKEAAFWVQLGKLYAAIVLQPDKTPPPDEVKPVNAIFKKALRLAPDDFSVMKDVADFFAASLQIQEAIPLYLRVLELQPNDSNAREKLATGFLLTHQHAKAIEMLQEVIKQHPEQYQSYELLGRVLEEEAKALDEAKKTQEARDEYAKAAANYEQSLLINPAQIDHYPHLAQLLLVQLHDNERAIKVMTDAQHRFPNTPQITYVLAVVLREAKRTQQALTMFEEALREGELDGGEIANGPFYFEYGAAAEQAGLYDKAAELFKKSIQLDPTNAAEAYNYLGFMWADHNTHLEEAADYINRALQADPNNGAYLDSLGWLDYHLGKYDQALGELLKAAQNLTRDDPTVFEHIGDTYFQLQQIPQAFTFWQKAIMLDPQNKKLAEKIESTKTKISKGEPLGSNPK